MYLPPGDTVAQTNGPHNADRLTDSLTALRVRPLQDGHVPLLAERVFTQPSLKQT